MSKFTNEKPKRRRLTPTQKKAKDVLWQMHHKNHAPGCACQTCLLARDTLLGKLDLIDFLWKGKASPKA